MCNFGWRHPLRHLGSDPTATQCAYELSAWIAELHGYLKIAKPLRVMTNG